MINPLSTRRSTSSYKRAYITRACARARSDRGAILAKRQDDVGSACRRMAKSGLHRGWSCRSSDRPREIDHLALLFHPSPPPHYLSSTLPPSLSLSLALSLSSRRARARFLRIPSSCETPFLALSLSPIPLSTLVLVVLSYGRTG